MDEANDVVEGAGDGSGGRYLDSKSMLILSWEGANDADSGGVVEQDDVAVACPDKASAEDKEYTEDDALDVSTLSPTRLPKKAAPLPCSTTGVFRSSSSSPALPLPIRDGAFWVGEDPSWECECVPVPVSGESRPA